MPERSRVLAAVSVVGEFYLVATMFCVIPLLFFSVFLHMGLVAAFAAMLTTGVLEGLASFTAAEEPEKMIPSRWE